MPTELVDGHRTWSCSRDADGHRTYKIKHRVRCLTSLSKLPATYGRPDPTLGPATALLFTPGLPLPGRIWAFDNDLDPWAWCRPEATVTPVSPEGEPNTLFDVEQIFSTRPNKKCHDLSIEDPLLEPQKVNGGVIKDKEEAVFDRFNVAITNSAFEQMRGPHVEFDKSRSTTTVEQNVPILNKFLCDKMMDTLNSAPLWGFPARCIKLSDWTWTENYFGLCARYYVRKFTFESNVKFDPDSGRLVSGWDKDLLDEGTKALNGHWDETTGKWVLDTIGGAAPNPNNPSHFKRVQDRDGNVMRVVLNGQGVPIESEPGTGTGFTGPGSIHVEKYEESNFLVLGIPVILGP